MNGLRSRVAGGRVARAVLLAALALGCSEAQEPVAQEPAPAPPPGPTEIEMVASMEAHYSTVILAHDALVLGDLESFRAKLATAADLELPEGSPANWHPYHDQLERTAAGAAEAADLGQAAAAMGQVVAACGACHHGLEVPLFYEAPAPPDGATPVETKMLQHQWATERLWEGITGPWDLAWQRGAATLAETRFFTGEGPPPSHPGEYQRREEELRALGREAEAAENLGDRAALYGRLLATCAGCHEVVGLKPPPTR